MSAKLLHLAAVGGALLQLASAQTYGDWQQGTATLFGGPADNQGEFLATVEDGACGYGELDPRTYPFWDVVWLPQSISEGAGKTLQGCGSCWEVECISGEFCKGDARSYTLNVNTIDVCNDCGDSEIRLQAAAFDRIADISTGGTTLEVAVRYRLAECITPGGLVMMVREFDAEGGALELALLGAADISGVELRGQGEGWQTMENSSGAVWQLGSTPPLPLDVQVKSKSGSSTEMSQIITQAGYTGVIETFATLSK